MADGGGPTYASLTPANPTIINGYAGVDLQTAQQLTTQQTVMNDAEQALVNSMNMVNTVGVGSVTGGLQSVAAPTMTNVMSSPIVPVTHHQTVPVNHQTVPVNHQTVSVNHQTVPVNHQTVPVNHQTVPVTHQTVPVTHHQTVLPVTHQTVPVTHQTVPVTHHQTVPVTHHQTVPVTHQTVPVTHQTVPVTHQTVPVTHHQTVPVTHQQTVPVTHQQTVPVTHHQTVPVTHQTTPEATPTPEVPHDLTPVERNTLIAVLQFLKKNNLKGTEDLLRNESNFFEEIDDSKPGLGGDAEVSSVLSAYKSEGDPAEYQDAYMSLQAFIEKSLDAYKHEVSLVLYPVFVHMYLELVYNGHEEVSKNFLQKLGPLQEDYYQDDLHKLSLVTSRDHMTGYQIMDNFRSSQFTVRMSRDTYSHLKRYLTERGGGPVPRIIHDRLYLDVYEGVPRTRNQVLATAGAQEGEAPKQVNKSKIFYGLLKEPELPNLAMEEEEGEEEGDKPKKKKPKKDSLQKSKKNDPNAPPSNRIPLPELRDIDKMEKAKAFRDQVKRVNLNKDTLPSICFYTFLNASGNITSIDISDDSSLLAYASADSQVRVQSITPSKLRCMKSTEQLNDIDKDADDVLVRMMDDRTAEPGRTLLGHSGPVYSCCFSPDRNLLLTAGEDGTIRLWSLQTWSCLVVYKGHVFAVWDVSFSPHGYYFASGGHDRTGRLWATDHHQPLRIFAGHFSDVDVVQFHPNSNYVATGSSDRSIRIWDNQNGNCVRVLTGHKNAIDTLAFSPCGRFLASAGGDKRILVWDMAHGNIITEMASHTSTIYTIAFSRDCNILASGGLDNCVKLWDFGRVLEDNHEDDINVSHNADVKRGDDSLLLGTFPTKSTPILATHFTRRNVLLVSGPFEG